VLACGLCPACLVRYSTNHAPISFLGRNVVQRVAIIKFVSAVVIGMFITGRRWLGLRKSRHLCNPQHLRPSLLDRFHALNASRCAGPSSIAKSITLNITCHPSIPDGASLEMIFEMPQEITGQADRRVLCRGEVARSAFAKSGTVLVGVAISGYCFLQHMGGRSLKHL
jgi:hypothetical protein